MCVLLVKLESLKAPGTTLYWQHWVVSLRVFSGFSCTNETDRCPQTPLCRSQLYLLELGSSETCFWNISVSFPHGVYRDLILSAFAVYVIGWCRFGCLGSVALLDKEETSVMNSLVSQQTALKCINSYVLYDNFIIYFAVMDGGPSPWGIWLLFVCWDKQGCSCWWVKQRLFIIAACPVAGKWSQASQTFLKPLRTLWQLQLGTFLCY